MEKMFVGNPHCVTIVTCNPGAGECLHKAGIGGNSVLDILLRLDRHITAARSRSWIRTGSRIIHILQPV